MSMMTDYLFSMLRRADDSGRADEREAADKALREEIARRNAEYICGLHIAADWQAK